MMKGKGLQKGLNSEGRRSVARQTILASVMENKATSNTDIAHYIATRPYKTHFRGVRSITEMEDRGLPLAPKDFYVILLHSPSNKDGHWVALIRGYSNTFLHFSSFGEAPDNRIQAYVNHFLHVEKDDKRNPVSKFICSSEDLQDLTGSSDSMCGAFILYLLDHLLDVDTRKINGRFESVLNSFTMDPSSTNVMRLQEHFKHMAVGQSDGIPPPPAEPASLPPEQEVAKRANIEETKEEMLAQ